MVETSTQTLGVTISGISRGELEDRRDEDHISRELRISLINSAALALLTFAVALVFLAIRKHHALWEVSLILSVSMFFSVNISSFVGLITPIVFKKIGFDPAVASAPLITTISDIFAVFIYDGFAALLIHLRGGMA